MILQLLRDKIIFSLFGYSFYIKFYSISYLISFILIYKLIQSELFKRKIKNIDIFNIQLIMLIGGYIGARAWHKIMLFFEQGIPIFENLFQPFQPGLAFQGGLLGAILFLVFYLFLNQEIKHLVTLLDMYANYLPLGIAIVRFCGNYPNKEFIYPGYLSIGGAIFLINIALLLTEIYLKQYTALYMIYTSYLIICLSVLLSITVRPIWPITYIIDDLTYYSTKLPMCICLGITEGIILFAIISFIRRFDQQPLIASSSFLIFY